MSLAPTEGAVNLTAPLTSLTPTPDVTSKTNVQTALIALTSDSEIKVVDAFDQIWLSIQDLAKAWGLDRTTLRKHILRHPKIFEGTYNDGDKLSQHNSDIYVNEEGLYLLLGRINTKKLRPDIQDALIEFRKRAPGILKEHRLGQIVPTDILPPIPLTRSLEQNADVADLLVERFKWSREQANNFAFDQIKKETGVLIALPQPSVLSHSDPSENWMSPTDLGKECGLTGEQVNAWLYNNKLQYPTYDGPRKIWRLTDTGEPYGEEFVMEFSNKHSEIRIRWRPSVKEFAPGIRRVQPIVGEVSKLMGR